MSTITDEVVNNLATTTIFSSSDVKNALCMLTDLYHIEEETALKLIQPITEFATAYDKTLFWMIHYLFVKQKKA